ncbi:MAG TPA: acyl-CoA thioesterase [Dehalococcoidales bacterium]|nr:acyl-CoA thioesterase [Dehalococcoidales bacterium]
MEGKKPSETAVTVSQLMGPQEVNSFGNVHGGVIMRLIDTTAGIVAVRHCRSNAVTASIERIDFFYPAYSGDLITLKARLNYAGKTSLEIGVRVETENLITGEIHHTNSAYVTYVALDKAGRPREIPPLVLETEEDIRRNKAAILRRENRQKTKSTQAQKENREMK